MINWDKLFWQLLRRAASRAAWIAGNNNPTNTPMMAITTNSSTKVKPELSPASRRLFVIAAPQFLV
jgi:hypothetical protein